MVSILPLSNVWLKVHFYTYDRTFEASLELISHPKKSWGGIDQYLSHLHRDIVTKTHM